MARMSVYLEKKILDKILRGTDFTISTVYVSLHTGDPDATGANEVAGGSYARQQANHSGWNAAAMATLGSQSTNVNDLTYTAMPACTITHVGIWDAVSGGNFLMGGPTIVDSDVSASESFVLSAGFLAAKVI